MQTVPQNNRPRHVSRKIRERLKHIVIHKKSNIIPSVSASSLGFAYLFTSKRNSRVFNPNIHCLIYTVEFNKSCLMLQVSSPTMSWTFGHRSYPSPAQDMQSSSKVGSPRRKIIERLVTRWTRKWVHQVVARGCYWGAVERQLQPRIVRVVKGSTYPSGSMAEVWVACTISGFSAWYVRTTVSLISPAMNDYKNMTCGKASLSFIALWNLISASKKVRLEEGAGVNRFKEGEVGRARHSIGGHWTKCWEVSATHRNRSSELWYNTLKYPGSLQLGNWVNFVFVVAF